MGSASRGQVARGFGILLAVSLILPQRSMAKGDKDGFIYGKVTTNTGNTYTGVLRWDTEEQFWDDLFNSTKEDLPYADYLEDYADGDRQDELRDSARELEREARRMERDAEQNNDENLQRSAEELQRQAEKLREQAERLADKFSSKKVSVLGGAIRVNVDNWYSSSRIIVARYGDIRKLKVVGSEDAELTMKSGQILTVSGYSNDVGADIRVLDSAMGEVTLSWKKIDTIEFMPTPSTAKIPGSRIYGTVTTDAGDYQGFIQWDSEECLSGDKLDGDSEDGRMSIEMGSIKSIERRNRNSCRVELKDSRKLTLDGTNDVDGSIRGIMIEDPRYGRVKVGWDSFEKVVFTDGTGSGRGYDDYRTGRKMKGTVTDSDGKTWKGRIVYDLDEEESWEMLNGDRFDVEYNIPFELINSITPRTSGSSNVVLINGETLRLENSQDVGDANDGVLIFQNEKDDPKYIEWSEIEKIAFEW